VCSVASHSPAEEAGVLAGDEIVAVGAQCIANSTREELLELLAGEHGSQVT
jgi:C-terminal processing protease CtpA/Prc